MMGDRPRGLLALMALAILAELGWRLATRRGYDVKVAASSLGLAAGNLVFGLANGAAIGLVLHGAWLLAPVRWPLADWRTWTAGFLLTELAYYVYHRLSHEVRWMWANHVVHHSAEELTFLAAIRLGWTNFLSGAWIVYIPLVLLGFDPSLVLVLLAFNLRYQFFLHTEAIGRLGPLEWVLNTPSHHRVHHGSNRIYLDRNYGGVLIIFDRLFGTFAAEKADEPIRYGLTRAVSSANPLILAFDEWRMLLSDLRAAKTWRRRLAIALGRPGASI